MSTLSELIHYCNEEDPIGALLLTGEWGCGKSYLIENDLTKALEKTHIIVKVSLFGIADAAMLRSTVRQNWFEACTPMLGKLHKAKEKGGGFLAAFNTALHAFNPLAGTAADVMVSMNMMDVLPIKAELEDPKTLEKKRVILVYDDLERVKMDPVELMGLINDYCENQGFNTIIISESDEVLERMMSDETTYHMLREKTISRSLRYIPDFTTILRNILRERAWPSAEYADYLSAHEALILDVFASDYDLPVKLLLTQEDGKYHNLRSLTKGLESFYRIYYHMQEAGIPISDKHFFSFLAYYLAAKSGLRKGGKLNLEFDDSDLEKFYPGYSQDALTDMEREWIKTGIWDENTFLEEARANAKADEAGIILSEDPQDG